jgi:mannose-6-phosphate isomerase-like protein (cupin superfamily)
MPMSDYTIRTLGDVPDSLGDYPGEMQYFGPALDCRQVAVTYRRMPQHTGGKGSYGHFHRTQEELYVVVSGKLQFKLDDDVVEVARGGVVRVAPEVVRSIWNDEPEDAEVLIVSTRNEGSAGDAVQVPDFWPE